MARIVVRDGNQIGWFDPDASQRYDDGIRLNGFLNRVGCCSGSEFVDEYLYRTPGGRWVLNTDSARTYGGGDRYEFVPDDAARDWLVRSEVNDAALAEHFPDTPTEAGPGRPGIGPAIKIRMTQDILDRLEVRADALGTTRSALIRQAVDSFLGG